MAPQEYTVCLSARQFTRITTNMGKDIIKIQDRAGCATVPALFPVTIGEKKTRFLLDTGSDINFVSNSILNDIMESMEVTDLMHSCYGINGKAQLCLIIKADIKFLGETTTETFMIPPGDQIFQEMNKKYAASIDGILGLDFISKYGIVIDYNNLEIRVNKRS